MSVTSQCPQEKLRVLAQEGWESGAVHLGEMKLKGALLQMRATLQRCKRHRALYSFVPVKAHVQVRVSVTEVHVVAAL
jgi:hypothetical protein